MANQQQSACPVCQGGKMVSVGGQAQVCPLCQGLGTSKIPGLKYAYGISFLALAGNATSQQNISILNAPFRWMFAMASSTGSFTVQIADGKTSRQFMNVALDSRIVFGNAQLPFPVVPTYTFPKNGIIQVNVTDTSGAGNTIWIGFDGQELVEGDATQIM